MTSTPATTPTPAASEGTADGPEPSELRDPRPLFARTLDTAATVIAGISADDAGRPTPATDYDVDHLVRHVVAVVDRVAAVARGEDPLSVPQEVAPLDPEEYRAAFDRARAGQEAVWADDGVLERELTLPFAVLPGAIALSIYVGEITVHTWDLAVAIGAEVDWDPAAVETALISITTGLPAEPRGGPDGIPFDPVVPTAEDATAIERTVAWTGRDPAWRRP